MNEETTSWVVYLMPVPQGLPAGKAICEQHEWDAMELAKPGLRPLVLAGITSEAEAEKLARGEDTYVSRSKKRKLAAIGAASGHLASTAETHVRISACVIEKESS